MTDHMTDAIRSLLSPACRQDLLVDVSTADDWYLRIVVALLALLLFDQRLLSVSLGHQVIHGASDTIFMTYDTFGDGPLTGCNTEIVNTRRRRLPRGGVAE